MVVILLVSTAVPAIVFVGIIALLLVRYVALPGVTNNAGPIVSFSFVPALVSLVVLVAFLVALLSATFLWFNDFKPLAVHKDLVFPNDRH